MCSSSDVKILEARGNRRATATETLCDSAAKSLVTQGENERSNKGPRQVRLMFPMGALVLVHVGKGLVAGDGVQEQVE